MVQHWQTLHSASHSNAYCAACSSAVEAENWCWSWCDHILPPLSSNITCQDYYIWAQVKVWVGVGDDCQLIFIFSRLANLHLIYGMDLDAWGSLSCLVSRSSLRTRTLLHVQVYLHRETRGEAVCWRSFSKQQRLYHPVRHLQLYKVEPNFGSYSFRTQCHKRECEWCEVWHSHIKFAVKLKLRDLVTVALCL